MSYTGRAVIANAILNPHSPEFVPVGDYLPRDFAPSFPFAQFRSYLAKLPIGILLGVIGLAAENFDVEPIVRISVLSVHAGIGNHWVGNQFSDAPDQRCNRHAVHMNPPLYDWLSHAGVRLCYYVTLLLLYHNIHKLSNYILMYTIVAL